MEIELLPLNSVIRYKNTDWIKKEDGKWHQISIRADIDWYILENDEIEDDGNNFEILALGIEFLEDMMAAAAEVGLEED